MKTLASRLAALALPALIACGGQQQTDGTSSAFLSGGEDEYYEAAIADRREGDLAGAEQNLRNALTANPRYLAAHLALGDLYLEADRTADARDAYGAALALRDASVDAHAGMARAQYALGDLAAARTHAERAVSLTDDFTVDEVRSSVWSLLGQVHFAAGDTAEAEDAFTRSLEIDSTNTDARIEMARVQARTGRMAEAVRMLTSAGAFEDDPGVLLRLGALYHELHLYDRAAEILQRAHEAAPSNDDIAFYLGASVVRLGRAEIAIQLASAVIARSPDYLDAYPVRGRAELMRGYPDRARSDAAVVLAARPEHYAALLLDGDVAFAADDFATAEQRYRAAQLSWPDDIDAPTALATLFYRQRRWAEFVEIVEPRIDRVDAPSGWRAQLVDALLGEGRTVDAIRQRSLLAETRPQDYELHRDVARAALDNPGALPDDQILRHARNAFERSGGGTMEYRLLYFDALLANGMTDDAAAQLEVALQAWPNNPEVQRRRDLLRQR